MKLRDALIATALFAAFAGPAAAQTAVLRGLDKVTGHARDFAAPIGRATRFGSLEVIARACSKSAPEDTPEVAIYLEVFDTAVAPSDQPAAQSGSDSSQAGRREIFHGWIFASSPGLNALEHPVYDLWSIDCRA